MYGHKNDFQFPNHKKFKLSKLTHLWQPHLFWGQHIMEIIVTVWAKIRHVHTQTEIHFIAPASLNNYACALPPLANVDWSAFPECFLPTM